MPVGTVEVGISAMLVMTLVTGILTMLTMVVVTMFAKLTSEMKLLKLLKLLKIENGVVVTLTAASAFHSRPAWPLTCGRQSLPAAATLPQGCRW
jgi:hypothetical protein